MSKTLEDNFVDWESHVFGHGYGTGEEHVLTAVKAFMAAVGKRDYPDSYEYPVLEASLTPTVAWLLINTFCHHHIIEYGTSPRFGWLTDQGKSLRDFVSAHSVAELERLVCEHGNYYVPCYPDCCNCEPVDGAAQKCVNPFWSRV